MAYKLLALDFDGTLLSYGTPEDVSPRVLAALHAAKDAGVTLCAATGRSHTEAEPALRRMAGLFDYGVMANGAQVYRFPGEMLASHAFTAEEARAILEVLRGYPGLFLQVFLGSEPYCEDAMWQQQHLLDIIESYTVMAGQPISRTPSFEQLFAKRGRTGKFFVIANSIAQAAEITRAVRALGLAEVTGSSEDNVEIAPRGVSKVSGVTAVCEAMGIGPGDVMAIGDSENDHGMLAFVGLGVAMGNAAEGVKAAANVVTASVEEDGAALAIEQYLLGGGKRL